MQDDEGHLDTRQGRTLGEIAHRSPAPSWLMRKCMWMQDDEGHLSGADTARTQSTQSAQSGTQSTQSAQSSTQQGAHHAPLPPADPAPAARAPRPQVLSRPSQLLYSGGGCWVPGDNIRTGLFSEGGGLAPWPQHRYRTTRGGMGGGLSGVPASGAWA